MRKIYDTNPETTREITQKIDLSQLKLGGMIKYYHDRPMAPGEPPRSASPRLGTIWPVPISELYTPDMILEMFKNNVYGDRGQRRKNLASVLNSDEYSMVTVDHPDGEIIPGFMPTRFSLEGQQPNEDWPNKIPLPFVEVSNLSFGMGDDFPYDLNELHDLTHNPDAVKKSPVSTALDSLAIIRQKKAQPDLSLHDVPIGYTTTIRTINNRYHITRIRGLRTGSLAAIVCSTSKRIGAFGISGDGIDHIAKGSGIVSIGKQVDLGYDTGLSSALKYSVRSRDFIYSEEEEPAGSVSAETTPAEGHREA